MQPLGRRVAFPGSLIAIGLLLLSSQLYSQFSDKPRRIQFEAVAVPSAEMDPFSDRNQLGAKQPTGPLQVKPGEVFTLSIRGTLEPGWHTYPLTQRAPDQPVAQLGTLKILGEHIQPLFPIEESQPEWKDYRKELDAVYLEHEKPFTWNQDIYVKPTASAGKPLEITAQIRVQVCEKACIWEDHTLTLNILVLKDPPIPPTAELTRRLGAKAPEPRVVELPERFRAKGDRIPPPTIPSVVQTERAEAVRTSEPSGLLASVIAAIIGGLVSLLTPCVFPMIPITVSYFIKQGEVAAANSSATSRHPVLLALIYSGTITLVLTIGGMALLQVLVQISTHPITNYLLGAMFLFFALSLLGWYDITLPGWLQDMTASGEGRGGLLGVFFMALTFSIISFACVGPIYGSFIGLQASSSGALGFLERLLPVMAYSAAFASPFFLLALFPTLLRTMPRAGSWMNAVKVVMGFLELAAVVKFFRAGELLSKGRTDILTYDFSMGLYVAISIACGLYLLNLYRLPHDHDAPESVGVPRLMFALGFLALGIYLLPALYKTESGESQRPTGTIFAWIDSFLLPDPETPKRAGGKTPSSGTLVWEHKLDAALARARSENKLIFIDFTGTVCTNCKLNERQVFPLPEVQQALARHVLLQLYTDVVPAGIDQQPDARGSVRLRSDHFNKSDALPLYALLRPTETSFEVLDRYGSDTNGLIEDVPAFVRFLTR